jgi:enoyl-CoA hydratase
MPAILLESSQPGVYRLTLNRPEVRNALNLAAMTAFAGAVAHVAADTEARILVIRGAGTAFCAGGDLKEMQASPEEEYGYQFGSIMGDALNQLAQLQAITIAWINGPVRGGGVEVALSCDLRWMAQEADLAFVHTRLGLIPVWGGLHRLQRIGGESRALELLATGRVVSAAEAFSLGLVNRIVPVDDIERDLDETIAAILNKDHQALMTVKRLLRENLEASPAERYRAEKAAFFEMWNRPERKVIFDDLGEM